jgi:hypothetical protein
MVALDNGNDPQRVSLAVNFFQNEFGDPRITDFNLAKTAVASELATALKGQATDREIDAWAKSIHSSQSAQQFEAAVRTPMHLMAGRLGASEQKYRNTMNEEPGNTVIYPYTRNVFQKFGVAPTTGGPAQGGNIPVKAPNGKTYHFKSQADADAFKQKAGIQ